MAVFSVKDRDRALDTLVAAAKECAHIVALVAVGSGAYGYNDAFSDIDLVAALDEDAHIPAAMEHLHTRLAASMGFIYFKQAPQRRMQVYLRDDFLEIDIGFGAYTGAAAWRKDWWVLFDKSGTVDARMRASWAQIQSQPVSSGYARQAALCADIAPHSLFHAAVALRRGQGWRAAAELALAREQFTKLLCSRYGLEADHNKDVDKLPEAERNALAQTWAASPQPEAQWQSLYALTNALYTALEEAGEPPLYEDVSALRITRRQVLEYVDHCRATV